ncbi:MAG: hypothetical protein H7Y31_06850 [Chitinophagaceae bacterium]|nr:hypothetical protein [Chitinophagaceae bacterium]
MSHKIVLPLSLAILLFLGSFSPNPINNSFASNFDSIPGFMIGNFTDDYGVQYSITDSVWTQLPRARYHILEWNAKDKYLIARNDSANASEPGLYSRIDVMEFSGMAPFQWGFCLSVYDAPTQALAKSKYQADRVNPRKGCNGFPFSRMRPKE